MQSREKLCYWCGGPHEINDRGEHATHILSLIEKSISLGEGHRAHNVEGKELQPLAHVDDLLRRAICFVEFILNAL